MKIKIIFIFLNLSVLCLSLKTRSLETMRLATKSTEEGEFDIIKILNINDTDIDNQETRILRRKMKKSDLENFEGYLDSYLNILKKFNKRISQNKAKKLTNLTFEIMHKTSKSTNKPHSRMNFTSFNHTNDSVSSNTTNNTSNDSHSKINCTSANQTKILNRSNLTCSVEKKKTNASSNMIVKEEKNKSTSINLTQKVNNTNTSIQKFNSTSSSNLSLRKQEPIPPQKINVQSGSKTDRNHTLNNKENSTVIAMKIKKRIISQLDEKANQNIEDQQKIEDKLVEKVTKKNVINEEFIQKQKELINSANNIFMNDSNDFNIYKKIINISLSLIVVGLLMGILLGLILVMYLNSRSSK